MKIRLFLLLSLFAGMLRAQQACDSVPKIAYEWYPHYVTFLPADRADSVLAYAKTDIVPVVYQVNKYKLNTNAQIDSIVHLVNRVKCDCRVRLAYVWIGGSASPEGPLRWNRKLGEYRSKALADYLLAHTELDSAELRVQNLGEDWASVTEVLQEQPAFPYRDDILRIIATEPDTEKRKRDIRDLDGGRTWTELVRTVFPPFRNSRMVIVCHAEDIRPEPPLPVSLQEIPMENPESLPKRHVAVVLPESDTHFFAVKTNTLFLAALVANAGVEVELRPHWSLDIPVWYSPYNITPRRKLRLLAVQPEVRRWFSKAGEGHFIGLHTHVMGFNVAVNDHGRYQDPNHALWGMGISYGYAMNLGARQRWGLEFNLGVGFADYDYEAYHNWDNGSKFRSGSNCYWGITRAGISISYKWYKDYKQGRRDRR